MATMVSRQASATDLQSYYNNANPPSPKSLAFPKSQGHMRRPSFTSWLSGRTGGSGAAPLSPATKQTQISDPQPVNAYDAAARAPGALGKGATIVRTPGQARTPSLQSSMTLDEKDELPVVIIGPTTSHEKLPETQPLVPRRDSPVLASRRELLVSPRVESPVPGQGHASPVPIPSSVHSLYAPNSQLQTGHRRANTSPFPERKPPLPLNLVSSSRQPLLRSALRPSSPTKALSSDNSPILPPLPPPQPNANPAKETNTASLPPFHPVLLSGVPTHPTAPSQVIVTLETSTVSQRTTIATLTSRPSRLASYLQALVPSANPAPTESNFSSLFAAHLAQAGLVPQIQPMHTGPIHIFLDRPSAPYAHILTYLRAGSGSPGVLPRAASLALSTDAARVEALCELRDEARYLELSELAELCDRELRVRAPRLRTVASSSSLRDHKVGSGSEGSRVGSGEVEARLREYKFGEPLKEESEEEEEQPVQEPPLVAYEKKGSHAGIVITVPPRGSQLVGPVPQPSHGRTPSSRAPSSLSGRIRTTSDARYPNSNEQKTWL